MKEQEVEKQQAKAPQKKRRFRWLLWLLLALLILLIAIPLIIQLKPVQKWLIDKVTDNLSERTSSVVSIEAIDFSVFSGLLLNDLYVSSPEMENDTLMYVGEFSTSLTENILSLLKKEVLLDEISLSDAMINIKKMEGDNVSNLRKFLLRLSNEDNDRLRDRKSYQIDLEQINFNNTSISITDETLDDKTYITLDNGYIDFEAISIEHNSYDINKLFFSNPSVIIEKGKDTSVKVKTSVKNELTNNAALNLPVNLTAKELEIVNGYFSLNDKNHRKINLQRALDYNHLNVSNIDINATDISVNKDFSIAASISKLKLQESSGFGIEELSVDELIIDTSHIVLSDFGLLLNDSEVKNYIEFQYGDFSDFKNFGQKIKVVSDMRGSVIAVSDLTYFFPELKTKPFFKENANSVLNLSGIVNGNLKNLEADRLNLAIDDRINLRGSISGRNLDKPKSAIFNMYIDDLNTSMSDLREIIPGFNPPAQFDKLGPIHFTGDIEGFFNDLVVYGNTRSDIGTVDLDMRLDTKDGINEARYSGEISLNDFDLNKWTGNPDLGMTTLSGKITDGKGLSFDNVDSKLQADLESFTYKGYNYHSVQLQGQLTKNQFVGSVIARDPNLDLDFDGEVQILDNYFNSDFKADIKSIDLVALNLSSEFSDITGNFDLKLKGSSISDFEGTATMRDLQLVYKEKSFAFDSLFLVSTPSDDENRNVIVYSDLLNVSLDGKFDLAKVGPAFKNLIYYEHPKWASKLGIHNAISGLDNDQKFRFKINIKDTKDYLELANVNDLRFKQISIEGSAGLKDNEYETVITIDTSYYKEMVFEKLDVESSNSNGEAALDLTILNILSGNRIFEPISITTSLEDDVIDVRLKTENILDSIGMIDIGLSIEPEDDMIAFRVRNNELDMLGSNWNVSGANKILVGKEYIGIDSLTFSDGYRMINLSDIRNKGIQGQLSNFDFLIINGIIDYERIKFAGEGDVKLKVESIYSDPVINGLIDIPEFTLNDEDYGRLVVKATDRNEGFVNTLVTLINPTNGMSIYVEGDYVKDRKYVNAKVDIDDLPLDIFEFIIEDGISLTSGTTDIDAGLFGDLDNMTLIGEGKLKEAATRVNYLGNYITIGDEPITINTKVIDFTGVTIRDKYNNEAILEGGFVHDLFRDFGLDLTINSDKFLALDTDKSDNPMYYGQGMGAVEVSFLGPVNATDINVTAEMSEGSVLNIPIEDSYEDFDESFIKFVDRAALDRDTIVEDNTVILEGADVEMNLSITEAAQVNIIFDEKTNDVIRGNGVGDMRVVVTREGDFNVFGDYEVFDGEYLFTAWGIVAKPFKVRKGGNITWTGDPVNANINIEADYEDLRVPTNIFLQEYLVTGNDDLRLQSRKRTRVDLTLDLTGTLYKPIVNFDIKFPELQGELRSFADAKLRSLKENSVDLNEQVAGLIIFRSFLPSNRFGNVITTGSAVVETGYNTLSEFVSNQLSYLLSSILQEALTDNGFVSGIDFEIGISRNASLLNNANSNNNNYFPDEIEVHFKPRFQNDKWGIDYGTSFVNARNSSFGITNYVIHDVALEYFLTEDKRLKLRAYGKWDKDEVQFQNEQKYGLGLNYRKEFGSLIDFKKDMQEQMNKIAENPENE